MTRLRTAIKRHSPRQRSRQLLKSGLSLYAAYLILLIRLVAMLTVQMQVNPANDATRTSQQFFAQVAAGPTRAPGSSSGE